jgi:hypothetical protein
VTKYATGYGGKRNPIVAKNERLIQDELNETFLTRHADKFMNQNLFGYTVIREEDVMALGEEYAIPLILALLLRGNSVLYRPTATDPDHEYDIMIRDSTRLELVFYPETNMTHSFFKPAIQLNKPILFRITEKVSDIRESMLYKSLIMFESLQDLSDTLHYGSFQIVSRVRIGYMYTAKKSMFLIGGSPQNHTVSNSSTDQRSYEEGVKWLYGDPPAKTVQLIKKLRYRIPTRITRSSRKSKSRSSRKSKSRSK